MRKLLFVLNSVISTPALGLVITSCLVDHVQRSLKNTGVYPKFVKIADENHISEDEKKQIKESVLDAVKEAVNRKNKQATAEDYTIENFDLIDKTNSLEELKKIQLQVVANKNSKQLKGNTAKFALDIGLFPTLDDLGPRVGLNHIHVKNENKITSQEIDNIIKVIKERIQQIIVKKDKTITQNDYTITHLDTLKSKSRASEINAIQFEVLPAPDSAKLQGKATFSINVHAHH